MSACVDRRRFLWKLGSWGINTREDELHSLIAAGLDCSHLQVQGDDRHWYAVVVAEAFAGFRPVARHQKVCATLGERLKSTKYTPCRSKPLRPQNA